jgi:hypothetical protein
MAVLAVAVAAWWWYDQTPESAQESPAVDREPLLPMDDRDGNSGLPGRTPQPEQHALQSYLLAEADNARDSVLLSMIRDAGFVCEEIVHTRTLGDETAAWRVFCDETHTYVLEVDSIGELRIEPLFYGDRPPGAPPEPLPAPNQ